MVPLFRTLFFFTVFWLHQLLILPVLVWALFHYRRGMTPGLRQRIHRIGHNWGRHVCRLGGGRIQLRDEAQLPPGEAVLYVSNHQGDFDIPILLAVVQRPLAFVAKKELARIPLVSQWMKVMGCIFLDRDDRRKQVRQIRETVESLQSGLSMVIFPEGTRSRGPEMRPFAKGSLNIAERAGVRIVPVTIDGSYRCKPEGRFTLPGAKVNVTLHPPLTPADLPEETRNSLHEYVQELIKVGLTDSSPEESHFPRDLKKTLGSCPAGDSG